MKTPLLALAFLALAASATAQSNLYRWVDKDGKVHYTDTPPPPDTKDVQQKRLGGGAAGTGELPFQTRDAARRNPVVMYTASDCGEICVEARGLLVARGVPYQERNVSSNPKYADELKKAAGALQVPYLLVGAQAQAGFEPTAWQSSLDAGGYPRTNALSTSQRAAMKAEADKAGAAQPAPPKAPAAPAAQPAAASGQAAEAAAPQK